MASGCQAFMNMLEYGHKYNYASFTPPQNSWTWGFSIYEGTTIKGSEDTSHTSNNEFSFSEGVDGSPNGGTAGSLTWNGADIDWTASGWTATTIDGLRIRVKDSAGVLTDMTGLQTFAHGTVTGVGAVTTGQIVRLTDITITISTQDI